jgi:hypothetical protein
MTNNRSNLLRAPVLLCAVVAGLVSAPNAASSKGPTLHLPPPENVAATTLKELRARMSRHANGMSDLLRAVVLLDRPTISTLAGRIADDEVVARSEAQGLDRWGPLLPKAFFVEQDALRTTARDLAAAAAHGEPDDVLADRFGAVTRTCVRCHSVFLHGRPEAPAPR